MLLDCYSIEKVETTTLLCYSKGTVQNSQVSLKGPDNEMMSKVFSISQRNVICCHAQHKDA